MLAIVIPFYKIRYFEETLDSLRRQTCKNFRVYIGNDNSTEDPETLIEKFQPEIEIVYKKFPHNLGAKSLTKQWDRCIDLIDDEEWIMILGDDDFISENYVDEFYKSLTEINSFDLNLVRYASQIIWQENGGKSKIFTHPKLEKSTDFFCRKFIYSTTRSSLSEYIFKKEVYLKYGFRDFPLGWGADNIAWLEFSEFGNILSINKALAFIRMSSENLSRLGFEEDLKAIAKFEYFRFVIKNYLDEFKPEQRLKILNKWEILVYRQKKISKSFWLNMTSNFFREDQYIEILKFQRRVVLNYLKNLRFNS